MPRVLAKNQVLSPAIISPARVALTNRAQIVDALYGLALLDNNYYTTPNPGGEAGSSGGFGVAVLYRMAALPLGGVNRPLVDRSSGASGWLMYFGSGPLTFAACNSVPAFISTPSRTYLSTDVGKIHLAVGLHSGAGGFVRLYSDRRENGSGTAISGYTAASAPMLLGRSGQFSSFGNTQETLAALAFQGTPSLAQLQALYDTVRTTGEFPDSFTGATVTHRWSVKDELRTQAQVPATLTDKITGAAADLMTKQGSPTVVRIDPSIDGRRSFGVYGFSISSYLATANPGGIAGVSTGFWFCWYGVVYTTGISCIVARGNNTGTAGWQLDILGSSALTLSVANGSGSGVNAPTKTLVASDLGIPCVIHGVHDGSSVRLYFNGVEVGSGTAITGYTALAAAMTVGVRGVPDVPSVTTAFGVVGGHAVATAADVLAHAQSILATGRIQPIQGKTDHLWDVTRDTDASSDQTLVPAQILDRVGTDHLTAITIRNVTSGSKQGVTGFSDLTYFQSALNAGIAGQAAGFWVAVYIIVTSQAVASTSRDLAGRRVGSGVSGWSINTATTNATVTFGCANGAGSFLTSPAYTITAGDVSGAVALLVVGVHDGSNLRLYVKGAQVGSGTAITGFTTSTVPNMGLGNGNAAFPSGLSFGEPPDGVIVLGLAGGNGVPSAGEIATMDTACASANDIVAIPGKTDHLYSLKQDIAAAGGSLPIKSADRVGTDDLFLIGSGLVTAPRTERVWSYDSVPLMYGASAFTTLNYFSVSGGFGGTDKGFWVCWVGIITSQAVSSTTRTLLAKRGGTTPGWEIRTTGTNSLLSVVMGSSSSSATTGTSSIAAAEVGKLFVIIATYDTTGRVRWYLRRVENGSGTNLTGNYVAAAADMTMGKRSDGQAADGVTCLGFSCGDCTVSLPEAQALHDAIMAKERIQGIPGKTSMLVDVSLDVSEAGGVLPTTLRDRVGSQHMSMNGTVALASQYGRSWVW